MKNNKPIHEYIYIYNNNREREYKLYNTDGRRDDRNREREREGDYALRREKDRGGVCGREERVVVSRRRRCRSRNGDLSSSSCYFYYGGCEAIWCWARLIYNIRRVLTILVGRSAEGEEGSSRALTRITTTHVDFERDPRPA